MTIRIALYEPDIPQNTGTVLRLCACLGIEAHIIEPAGFPTSDRAFRRSEAGELGQECQPALVDDFLVPARLHEGDPAPFGGDRADGNATVWD